MADEVEMQLVFQLVGDQGVEFVMQVLIFIYPTEPLGEPPDVGIDGKVGFS